MGLQYSWKRPGLQEPSVSAVSMSLSCRGCWDCRVDALVCFFSAFLVRLMQVMTGLWPLPLDSVKWRKNEPIWCSFLFYFVHMRKLLFRFSPPGSVLFLDSSVALWPPFFPPTSFWIFFSVPCASSSLSDLLVWNEEALGNYSTWGRSEMLRTVDLSQSASRSTHTRFYKLLGILGNTKALPSGSDLIRSLSKICIFTLTFEFLIIWPLFP